MTAETAEKKTENQAPEETPKDMEVIIPEPGYVEIQGVRCSVRRLKMREFFGLMGIVTNGLGPAVANLGFDDAQNAQEFGSTLSAAFIMALPNQVPQFITFVQNIVEPLGNKQESREVRDYLDNPEIADMLPIIDAIIEAEKDNMFELVGKARAYMDRWTKTFTGNGPASAR